MIRHCRSDRHPLRRIVAASAPRRKGTARENRPAALRPASRARPFHGPFLS